MIQYSVRNCAHWVAVLAVFMPSKANFSPRNNHTVVLQSRVSSASKNQKNGFKQDYLQDMSGFPSKPPPGSAGPYQGRYPPRASSVRQTPQIYTQGESNLLERFGIDSGPGRMVTRVLTLLLLFQPIYVALGMEIEEQTEIPPVELTQTPQQEPVTQESSDEKNTSTVENPSTTVEDDEKTKAESEEEHDAGASKVASDEDETTQNEEGSVVEAGTTDALETTTDSTSENETEVVENEEQNNVESENELITDTTTSSEEAGSEEEENADNPDTSGIEGDEIADEDSQTETPEETTEETLDGTSENNSSSGGGGGSSNEGDTTDEQESDDGNGDEESDVSEQDTDNGENNGNATSTATSTDTQTEQETTNDETSEDEEEATTTPEVDEEEINVAQNPSNKYVFGEGDCTVVSDGEFYCVADGPERQQMTGDPRVYAQKDRQGDKEIYFFDGVEIRNITNNSYDDFAPMYDEETRRIVWQAMINDRLQIMMHELPTNITRQLTTSPRNSSNPSIAGDTVVWQEWVDTNWEIMMTDIDSKGGELEIEQLTDNVVHDMFPSAYDGLITWQSERGSSWEVIVYDMHTGKQHALEKDENTKYENPRFVLLFDSKHDNGDIETIGYDLDTGEMMELGTKPGQAPVEPVTPKEKTPEAIYREATSTPQIKIEGDEGDGGEDGTVVL